MRHRDELLDHDFATGRVAALGTDAAREVELDPRQARGDRESGPGRVRHRQPEVGLARIAVRRLVIGDRHALIHAVEIDARRIRRFAGAPDADKAAADRKHRRDMRQIERGGFGGEAPAIAHELHCSKPCFR